MKRKTRFVSLLTLALTVATSAFAQVGRLEGDIVKRGTTEGVPGAEIQIVRTDITGNYPMMKADKKGHFLHAGVPNAGTFVILVSAPGFSPAFLGGVRPAQGDALKFELDPGDGRKLTMADVNRAGGKSMPVPVAAPAVKQPSAAELKKLQEEGEAYARAKAANDRSEAEFGNTKKLFDSGIARLNAKDYSGAITDLTEATKLDADQKAIWANLGLALLNRGVATYNESAGDAAKRDSAKRDLTDAVAAAGKSLVLVDQDLADSSRAAAAQREKVSFLKIKADAGGLLAKRFGVAEMTEPSVKDYTAAADLSDLPADKLKYQMAAAEVYSDSGKMDDALAAYNKILEANPGNLEGIFRLALSYASAGKFQESANTFQEFLDRAPATDGRVPEVRALLKDLVVSNKLQEPKADPKRAPARR